MATQRFSVIFSADGLKMVQKEAEKVGKTYDQLLDDVRDNSEKTNRVISQSFKSLGVQSEKSLLERKRQAIGAFEAIKKSGTASARDVAAAQAALTRQLSKLDDQIKQVDSTARKTGGSGGGFTIMKGALATALGGGILQGFNALKNAIVGGGKAALDTAGKYEDFRNRLELLEGSAVKGELAFSKLKKLAVTLPIELEEVTQAYISLRNRGLKPTEKDITSLTDFAKANGKSLQQYVEAVLDASTGENERLKEFGVQAEKAGSKVTFTFKGQKTTVDASQASIQKYLIELGKLPSVAGYSEKAMGTLAGKTANFQDSLSQLQATIGEVLAPLAKGTLSLGAAIFGDLSDKSLYAPLVDGVNAIREALKGSGTEALSLGQILQGAVRETLIAIGASLQQIAQYLKENPSAVREWGAALKAVLDILNIIGKFLGVVLAIITKSAEGWSNILRLIGLIVEVVKDWWAQLTTASKWTDRLLAIWQAIKVILGAINPLFDNVTNAIESSFKWAMKTWDAIKGWAKGIKDAGTPLSDFVKMLTKVTGSVIDFGTDVGKKLGNAATSLVGNGNSGGPLLPAPGGAFHPSKFPITSPFGQRNGRLHAGTDYGTPMGTPLANIWGAGRVTMAGFVGGYGNMVELTTGNGDVYRFGHLDRINVRQGQLVPPGALMGFTGNTGRSSGPHLHLEYYPGGGAPVPYTGGRGGPLGASTKSGSKATPEQLTAISSLRVESRTALYAALREPDLDKLAEAYELLKKVIVERQKLGQSYAIESDELRLVNSEISKLVASQEALKNSMQETGETIDLELYPELQGLTAQVGFFESRTEEMASTISGSVASAFSGLFSDLFEGSKSFGDAILGAIGGILKNVANMFLQFAAQMLQDQLFKGLMSLLGGLVGGGGGLSFGGLFSGGGGGGFSVGSIAGFAGIGSFARGGYVRGPGTSTSDSILARLSNHEFVMPAQQVSLIGVSALEQLRTARDRQDVASAFLSSINTRALPGFSQGGLVGSSSSSSRSPLGTNITMTVVTPDANSFNRSEQQLGAKLGEQVRRAQQRK